MTKEERYAKLVDLGCICCLEFFGLKADPEIHHMTGLKFRSTGKKAPWPYTIPLCPMHHEGEYKHIPSVHHAPGTFEMLYGSQEALWRKTNELIGADEAELLKIVDELKGGKI